MKLVKKPNLDDSIRNYLWENPWAKLSFMMVVVMFLIIPAVSADAAFLSNLTSGNAPLAVQFADESTGTPIAWNWSFGDGGFSIIKNPVHVYTAPGSFSVSLNVSNATASNITGVNNYITVFAVTPTPTPTPTVTPTPTPTVTPTPTPTVSPTPTPTPVPTPTPNQTFTPVPPSPDFMSIQTGNTVTLIDTSAGDGLNYWVWSERPFGVGNWNLFSMNKSAQIALTPGKYEVYLAIRSVYFGQLGEKSIIKTVVVTTPSSGNTTVPVTNQSLIVFRPGNGDWFFDNNKDGVVDQRIHFGTGGDEPHYFDWNGDGVKDMVIFRPSNGNWYVDTNMDGQVDVFLHFGAMQDISVI